MVARLEYDSYVERLNSATVAAIAVILLGFILLIFASPAAAQFNGTPASVTTGGGGRFNSAPGVPASVTSMGPNGIQPRPPCCINPLFPANPNPPLFPRHHPRRQSSFFPIGGAYYVPYPVPVEKRALAARMMAREKWRVRIHRKQRVDAAWRPGLDPIRSH